VLHTPLTIGDRPVGALSLYRVAAGGFTAEEQALATVLAQHATVALDAARQERHLEIAADSRRSIGVAVGILMERFGFDSARAFGVLQRYSQDTNIKLREVADYLIATRELPPDRS
jgi:GAF domain-containing protein